MTPEQRKQEFDQLFASIPGKNIDKIRAVCGILHCAENTVRTWNMREPPRIIPECKVKILAKALAKKKSTKAK